MGENEKERPAHTSSAELRRIKTNVPSYLRGTSFALPRSAEMLSHAHFAAASRVYGPISGGQEPNRPVFSRSPTIFLLLDGSIAPALAVRVVFAVLWNSPFRGNSMVWAAPFCWPPGSPPGGGSE